MVASKTDRHGFARRLAKLRDEHELTQVQLGKKVGVTGTCVWNWEGGNTFPRSAALNKLAQALGTTVEYLSSGVGPSSAQNGNEQRANRSLAVIIMEAREMVAQAAGVPVGNVRVVLDVGD